MPTYTLTGSHNINGTINCIVGSLGTSTVNNYSFEFAKTTSFASIDTFGNGGFSAVVPPKARGSYIRCNVTLDGVDSNFSNTVGPVLGGAARRITRVITTTTTEETEEG